MHFDEWDKWKRQGYIAVFHGAFQKEVKWSWEYIIDLMGYSNNQDKLLVPALLIHGEKDGVIPVEKSIEFVNNQIKHECQIDAHYLSEGNHPLNNVFDQLRKLVIGWLRDILIPQIED
jgi:dipeptidyl aminopeptidase/acylaminoacyl peptidase